MLTPKEKEQGMNTEVVLPVKEMQSKRCSQWSRVDSQLETVGMPVISVEKGQLQCKQSDRMFAGAMQKIAKRFFSSFG